jgi:5-methylcytosine-specific restriction endonuclease McrA
VPYKDPIMARKKRRERQQRRRLLNPEKVREEGRIRAARYRARYPEKVKANNAKGYWRQYDKNNRELRKQKAREYRLNNPLAARGAVQRWHQKNRITDPEAVRIKARAYAKANRDKIRIVEKRVREKRRGAGGLSTREQVEARIAYYGDVCAYCGGPFEHLDHVIPLSRGGTGWPANLRPACKACNLSKHDRPLAVFLKARFGR